MAYIANESRSLLELAVTSNFSSAMLLKPEFEQVYLEEHSEIQVIIRNAFQDRNGIVEITRVACLVSF